MKDSKDKSDTIYKKIGRSPDRADSLVYAYHGVRWLRKHRAAMRRADDLIAGQPDDYQDHKKLEAEDLNLLPADIREIALGGDFEDEWEGLDAGDY